MLLRGLPSTRDAVDMQFASGSVFAGIVLRDDVLKRRSKGLPHIDDRKLKIQAMLVLEKNVRGEIHTDIKISFRAISSNVACFAVGCSHMHYSSLSTCQ